MAVKKPTARRIAATKKKGIKKVLPKSRLRWRVSWLRLVNNDEFISLVTSDSEGYHLQDPTGITYIANRLILVPYGLLARDRSFSFPQHIVLQESEVSDSVHELYLKSLEATSGYVEKHFDDLIDASIKVVELTIEEHTRGFSDPTAEDLEKIENEVLAMIDEVTTSTPKTTRSRTQVVDDLVALADKAGKGKKKKPESGG